MQDWNIFKATLAVNGKRLSIIKDVENCQIVEDYIID